MAALVDDVPLLVRMLAGNPVTGAFVFSCLDTADTCALRQLHPVVAGAVAGVPWVDTATPVVDVVRWRAALPGAVGARLVKDHPFSDAVVTALAGITALDLCNCRGVTDDVLLHLPASLRTLNVCGCDSLTARASFAHLSALVSLDCSDKVVCEGTAHLPPSLHELNVNTGPSARYRFRPPLPRGIAGPLTHLTKLRVLRAVGGARYDALTSLPLSLEKLDVSSCGGLTAAASFTHLRALQTLHAAGSDLCDAALTTLPLSLVYLDVRVCNRLTPAAVLPPLPALRVLDVSGTAVGDALVGSLPAGLEELHMMMCSSVTAGATLDHVRALRALYSTAFAPAVVAACRARGCAVPVIGALRGHNHHVFALAVLADGRLASGDSNGEVRLWDADVAEAGGDATAVLETGSSLTALAALPDGRLAIGTGSYCATDTDDSTDDDGWVEVWNVTSRTQVATLPCDSPVSALVVLADGRLAAGCGDGRVVVAGVGARVAVTAVLKGHSRGVNALAVLPDGALASGSTDGTVRVWDVGRKVCVAVLGHPVCQPRYGVHPALVGSLAVLADRRLACGTQGGEVALWDVGSCTRVGTLTGRGLAALPDGRLISELQSRGVIQLWDTRADVVAASSRAAGSVPMTALAHSLVGIGSLVLLPDGRFAFSRDFSCELLLLEMPPPTIYE